VVAPTGVRTARSLRSLARYILPGIAGLALIRLSGDAVHGLLPGEVFPDCALHPLTAAGGVLAGLEVDVVENRLRFAASDEHVAVEIRRGVEPALQRHLRRTLVGGKLFEEADFVQVNVNASVVVRVGRVNERERLHAV